MTAVCVILTTIASLIAANGQAPETAEDLAKITIPADAQEKRLILSRTPLRPEQREYRIGEELVGVREYYPKAQLAQEMLYRAGKLHGVWRQYHKNGKLFAERPYRHGVMDGEFRFWDEDGELMGSSKIENGTGLLQEFAHPLLALVDAETPYRENQIHGRVTEWAKYMRCQGIGVQFTEYADGLRQGPNVVRDGDGLILNWGFFKNDKLHGIVVEQDRRGEPVRQYPKYFINGTEVTQQELKNAAAGDRDLAASLKFQPPKYDKVPESPSQADAKKKAAEKAISGEKPK